MDGGGGRDASNFFSRIKNPDVLRSPYPRHIALPSRPPTMASSMRPLVGGGVHGPGPARPASMHARPSWTSPVPRLGGLDMTPASGLPYVGQFGRPPPAPGSYRSPAEFPSSVQPIRARQYAVADLRYIPGSTLPVHGSAGAAALRALPPGTQIAVLREWHVYIDVTRMAVTVSGSYTKPNGTTVPRHSAPIEMAYDKRVLLATTGTVYQLADAPDLEAMRMRGFPEHLVPRFAGGFPWNWKRLVEDYLNSIADRQQSNFDLAAQQEGQPRLSHTSPPGGYWHDGLSDGRTDNSRCGPISEESESAGASYAGAQSSRRLSGSSYAPGPSVASRTPVYRRGVDIFSARFPPTGTPQVANGFGERQMADRVRRSSSGQTTETTSPLPRYESSDDHGTGLGTDDIDYRVDGPSLLRMDSELATAMTRMPLETPTKRSATAGAMRTLNETSSSSMSPELMGRPFGLAGQHGIRASSPCIEERQSDANAGDVGQAFDEGSSDGQQSSEAPVSPEPASPEILPVPLKKTLRVSRRIVESSGESLPQPAAGNSSSEAATSTLETTPQDESALRDTAAGRPATAKTRAARRPSVSTPKTKSMAPAKAPNSAPVGRAKAAAKRTPARQPTKGPGGGRVPRALEHTPPKPPPRSNSSKRNSRSPTDPVVVIEIGPRVAGNKAEAPCEPAAGVASKRVEPKVTLTKWRNGPRVFKYNEPEASTSITRSGRKVRPPQDWWANAQEHLGSTHQESIIKYRWGTGDAVVVKDGKRVRLSDVFSEGSGADPLGGNTGPLGGDSGSESL